MRILAFSSLVALIWLSPMRASAQYSDEFDGYYPSREIFSIGIGAGMYVPNVGNDSFRDVFGKDRGPYLTGDLDFRVLRLKDFGVFTLGAHMGWARYGANACGIDDSGGTDCSNTVDEETVLRIFPLSVLAGLTVDMLARKWRVPFYLTGRVGLDTVFFSAKTGGVRDAAGASFGFRWEAELALELDFLDRRAHRTLDDEWGINHSYLFAKIFGSTASTLLPVGTRIAWVAGLGLVF